MGGRFHAHFAEEEIKAQGVKRPVEVQSAGKMGQVFGLRSLPPFLLRKSSSAEAT